MTKALKMVVQKWLYERGNYQIIIENAYSFDRGIFKLYAQERITINGDRIRDSIEVPNVILLWRTIFEDTIIDASGELPLKVQWRSGVNTIRSRLLIDEQAEDWTEYFQLEWTGHPGEWPDETTYSGLPSKD